MRTATFSRNQRMFGQRDWSAGEPYMVGERHLGVVTPEGAVDFNRHARFTEPSGYPWHEPPFEVAPLQAKAAPLGLIDAVVMVAITLLSFCAAVMAVYLESGL